MVTYRQALKGDIPVLAGLRGKDEGGGTTKDRMQRYFAGKHHPQHALGPRVVWMAEEGGRAIGYAAGHLSQRFGSEGELQWIYVRPDYRGAGVAAELLRLLAAWFQQQGARRICVNSGDERAQRFYRRHGATDLDEAWLEWRDVAIVSQQPSA